MAKDKSSKQVVIGNPSGKGGFADNPQNRSNGYWQPEHTISFQYRRFLKMTPTELNEYSRLLPKDRTVAMDIAYSQVIASRNSLPHAKEVTDRTEGRASQAIDITTAGESLNVALVEFVDAQDQSTDT